MNITQNEHELCTLTQTFNISLLLFKILLQFGSFHVLDDLNI